MTPEQAEEAARQFVFPNGDIGHWKQSPAVRLAARETPQGWRYDVGVEKIAKHAEEPALSRRPGWVVYFSLPDEVDGELLDVFPSLRVVQVYDDGQIVELL